MQQTSACISYVIMYFQTHLKPVVLPQQTILESLEESPDSYLWCIAASVCVRCVCMCVCVCIVINPECIKLQLSGSMNWCCRKYSVMGKNHALAYHHQHVTPFGRYSFINVDACPVPGPRRPFNFFGYLDDVSTFRAFSETFMAFDLPLTCIRCEW